MADQGSTYAILQSVPVMVSPLYNLPKKILVASELKLVPDDVTKLPTYSFAVEREVITQVEAARKQTFETEEAFKTKKEQYEQERINKQKLAARKIAPGFLDTDTRILQPQQTYVYEPSTTTSPSETEEPHMPQPYTNSVMPQPTPSFSGDTKHFDYLKFEQGLSPADPWDTPENDMVALRSILSSPKSNYQSPKSQSTPPSYAPYTTTMTRPFQKNEGVYWHVQSNNSSPNVGNYPTRHSIPVPALPPKVFNATPSTSSPVLPPPPPTLNSNTTPPPLPPLPSQPAIPHENLITELGHMGFTRAQAIDALEKNDHDLIKATNFLLDQA